MNNKTKKITILAMLTAMAFIVVAVCRIPVVLFLKYEPKDVIITIGGFIYGPLASLLISVLVSVAEMVTISADGIIGCVMNILSSAAFACTAAAIYKKKRTIWGAVIGLSVAVVAMTALMILWNYIVTPIYMNVTRDEVVNLILPAFLPFNIIKAALNMALTLLLYKPIVKTLRKARLLPEQEKTEQKKTNYGVIIAGTLILITCVLAILIFNKVI